MAQESVEGVAVRPFTSYPASATLEDVAVAKQKRIATRRVTSGTPAPAPRTLVVTDDNVEELKVKFDALQENDPEYDRLGDALHRYMIG